MSQERHANPQLCYDTHHLHKTLSRSIAAILRMTILTRLVHLPIPTRHPDRSGGHAFLVVPAAERHYNGTCRKGLGEIASRGDRHHELA